MSPAEFLQKSIQNGMCLLEQRPSRLITPPIAYNFPPDLPKLSMEPWMFVRGTIDSNQKSWTTFDVCCGTFEPQTAQIHVFVGRASWPTGIAMLRGASFFWASKRYGAERHVRLSQDDLLKISVFEDT
jgi:hypothetical protein